MSKITYTNKVDLYEDTSIADINKVKASDMNEIKTVVNNNDNNTTTNTNAIGTLTDLTTTNKDNLVNAINEVNDIYYQSGETITVGQDVGRRRVLISGFISSGTTTLILTFKTAKSLKNINNINCTTYNVEARGIKGYLNSNSGTIDFANTSGYNITCEKVDDYTIDIWIQKSSAFTNTANNTPINTYGNYVFQLT